MSPSPLSESNSDAAAVAARPSAFHPFQRLHRLKLVCLGLLFLLLAALSVGQGWNSAWELAAQRRTQALVGDIHRLRERLLDTEDALRVYQTTNNEMLLRQRLRCTPPCPSGAALQAQARDEAQQALFGRIADWDATLAPLLQQALDGGPAAAPLPLPAIGQMRRLLLQAEETELATLRRHEEAWRARSVELQLVLGATLLLGFIGLLLLQRRTRALVQAGLRAEAALEEALLRDPLTGAYNRRGLDLHLAQRLREARREQQPLALLALDLDGFKAVNDRHGHAAGDAALRETVARLHATLREDALITRTGGDEFVVALRGAQDEADARLVAQRLLRALEAPLALPGGQQARLGASIGLALFPRDGADAQTLLHAADSASYAAKRGGKHRVCSVGEPAWPSVASAGVVLRRVF
jgi:diguanylate cyclase (GGDEF)-like protein